MLMALRINVLVKGHSGVTPETLHRYIAALNSNCLPWVPEKGTVGASGDLAPLAHLALGLMGEGKMWNPSLRNYQDASKVLEGHNLKSIHLKAKEGLALINGTQLITALGAEAVYRAANVACTADIVSAMTVEALKGTVVAFDPRIHAVRPHTGQGLVAKRIRAVLHSEAHVSEIAVDHRDCGKVQDSYTLRCTPQVHGIVHDTIEFVSRIITTEMNSATDNPMVFTNPDVTLSGGNFHGEYPAKAMDYLAIGSHEIANISERRIERMVNGHLSGLPPFLTKEGGLNSGFMIAHCTAAALTSENKTLCHPASIDTISTSAAKEDHVSMGGWASRKALQVIENVETIVGIELLVACQAFDLLRPLTSTVALESIHTVVRQVIPVLQRDRYMAADIEAAVGLVRSGRVYDAVQPFLELEGAADITGLHTQYANLIPVIL
jgi:histidine ammonia-lyase